LVWTTVENDVVPLVERQKAPLVILDVRSGGDAAWRIAQAVTEDATTTPAILILPEISAGIKEAAIPSAVDLGLVALVPKPFTSDQLTRAVTTAAGRATGESETYDVLIVDDDEDSRRVAGRFLTERGMRVRECPDGETGLVEMRLRPPDVVVLDLMMPVLDGFGVLATIRADPLLASIPAVVLTAKSLTDAERQFLSRTAARVLQKGEHRLSDIASLIIRAAKSKTKT
jgi:CheY-like chemotaxis protein